MATGELTFTNYTELALARLYEDDQQNGPNHVVDIADLMADLGSHVSEGWPFDAAQLIVSRGWGHDFLTMQSATTCITAEGRVYVEEGRGSGIIRAYRESDQIVVVIGDQNQVAVGHGQHVTQLVHGEVSKEEALGLLDEAEQRLVEDGTLSEDQRADARADIDALRGQLAKKTPNRAVLAALAASLGAIASLAEIADKFRHLFS